MNRACKGGKFLVAAAAVTAIVQFAPAARALGAAGAGAVPFANGIRAAIHAPQELSDGWIVREADGPVLVHPAVGRVPLRDDAAQMVSLDPQAVLQAVQDMQGFRTAVDVEIFVLPAAPREVGGSYSLRGAILLAPGTGPVDPATTSFLTVHEMGHVLTWACLDGRPERWDAYLQLRGLDPAANGPEAAHADRAREILAEDLRFLFGGTLARLSGTIENASIPTPDRVPGLQEMLRGFLEDAGAGLVAAAGRAFPNPCNPAATIEMVVPGHLKGLGGQAVLRVFDARGALVRTLAGGAEANGRVAAVWDGTDGQGAPAASGTYFYVMTLERVAARGSLTLVR